MKVSKDKKETATESELKVTWCDMTQGDDPNATAEKCETRSVNEGTHFFSLTRSNQSVPSKHHDVLYVQVQTC